MSNELVVQSDTPAPTGGAGISSPGVSASDGHTLTPTPSEARRAEIERVRQTDIDRYFYEGMDRELIQYLKEEMGDVTPTDAMLPEQSKREMMQTEAGKKLIRDWSRHTSFATELGHVQSKVGKLVRALGDDRAQRAFMARFDRMIDEDLRYAIFDMILRVQDNSFVQPVSAASVETFRDSGPVCPEMVDKWGSEAPTRIARIWRRAEYLKLLSNDITPIVEWMNYLSDNDAKAVLEFASR